MLMDRETETWRAALAAYRYPVDLREYKFRADHQGWFAITMAPGSRDDTTAFESRFRENAPARLEAWFEVIFWKLASQKLIRNGTTHSMAIDLHGSSTAEQLWRACKDYTQAGSLAEARTRFEVLHRLFSLRSRSIATVATFPAFLDPDRFPMVDTRIAKWVGRTMDAHNRVDPLGPQLISAKSMNVKGAVLTMSDFDFMCAWTHWCRHAATKLTDRSSGGFVCVAGKGRRDGSV